MGRLYLLYILAFLLHPLKAESVVWISERKDVLSALFLWLVIYLYLDYLDRRRVWLYILTNLAFLFALASKASVVGLPLFLLVLDWYRNQTFSLKSLTNKIPFFVMALFFGIVNIVAQSRIHVSLIPPDKKYVNLLYQIQFYIEKTIFPWGLRALYSPQFLNFSLIGIFSIILISSLIIYIFKKYSDQKKNLLLGWSLFILFLLPYLKLIPFGDESIVHDRYMYISLTGLTIAFFPFVLQSIQQLWAKQKRPFSLAVMGVLITLMFQWLYLMHLQIPYWKDPITLWQYTASLEPNSKKVNKELAKVFLINGKNEEAIPYLQKSRGAAEDFANMGYALLKIKKSTEAEDIILEGLKKYPNDSSLLNILGVIELDKRNSQWALALFTEALQKLRDEINPKLRSLILNHIGLANLQLENFTVAESFFRRSISLINNDENTIYNLGSVLLIQNHKEEAKNLFLQTIKLNPRRAETYNNIGFIFYQDKNLKEARSWFNRALEIDPSFKMAKNNLIAMDKDRH